MDQIVVIVGPTASGKTAASIQLAKALNGEIISADSRQVYRGLDVGTGKVNTNEMQGVPHHLLDIADPSEIFSAAQYAKLGRKAIGEILQRGHVPIVVGGTGFYIDALLGTIKLPEVSQNIELRAELKDKSLEWLNEKLETLDPERLKTIDTKNRVRLVRAIEIAETLGAVPYMEPEKKYDALWLGITLPKEELEKNIHTRLFARIGEQGMLEEAQQLHANGLSYERMEELGLEYRYMARHLEGKITYEEMLSQLESEIKKYAKRQMTWFKRNKSISWFSPTQIPEMLALITGEVLPHRGRN